MKTKLILKLLLGMLLHGSAFAGIDTDIPVKNRVILDSREWKPTEENTQKALVAIQAFLEKPASKNAVELGEIKKIMTHTKGYRVQFIGETLNGRNLIFCNFFPANREKDFSYWKKEVVLVCDGGSAFWKIYYDPKTGECLKFAVNGEA